MAGLDAQLAKVQSKLVAAGDRMEALGKRLSAGVTIPVVALMGGAGREFMVFEKALSMIHGLAGATTDEVEKFRGEVLKLAPSVAKGPNELADALYFVASAGFKGDAAMRVLQASAKASTAGMGDTAMIADAATSAVSAYGEANLTAARTMDILVQAVREGKTEAPALAGAIGRVIPVAAQLGVTFDQVAAAIAGMSRIGLDANEGVTALRAILNTILAGKDDTKEAAVTLRKFGLSFAELRSELQTKGLLSTLFTLQTAFGDNETAMSSVFDNVRGLTGILALLGKNADNVKTIFANVKNSTGALDEAFDAARNTLDFRFKQALANIRVALVDLGGAMAPVFNGMARVISAVTARVQAMSPEFLRFAGITALVAAAIGPLLVAGGVLVKVVASAIAGFRMLAPLVLSLAASFAPVAPVVLAVVAAVTAVASAIFVAIGEGETFRDRWLDGFGKVWEFTKAFAASVKDMLVSWVPYVRFGLGSVWIAFKRTFEMVGTFVGTTVFNMVESVRWFFENWRAILPWMYDYGVAVFKAIGVTIWETFKALGETIGEFFAALWDSIAHPDREVDWPSFTAKLSKGMEGVWSKLPKLDIAGPNTVSVGDALANVRSAWSDELRDLYDNIFNPAKPMEKAKEATTKEAQHFVAKQKEKRRAVWELLGDFVQFSEGVKNFQKGVAGGMGLPDTRSNFALSVTGNNGKTQQVKDETAATQRAAMVQLLTKQLSAMEHGGGVFG